MAETQVYNGGQKFVDFDGLDYFWKQAKDYISNEDKELDKKISDVSDVLGDGTTDGLVKQVTNLQDVVDSLVDTEGDSGISGMIDAKIDALDFTDTAVTGEYISSVSQEDGVVKITRSALPKGVTEISYDKESKMIVLLGENGDPVGNGIDASDFVADGMLDSVAFEEIDGVKTNNLIFTFNTDSGKESFTVDFGKYVDVYGADGVELKLDSATKTFSIEQVDAAKAKIENDIKIAGGPLANNVVDSVDVWPSQWIDDNGDKIIPAGASLTEIITNLFLKVIEGTVSFGTVSWSPGVGAPTVTLSTDGPVEVGSKVKVSALSSGAFNAAKRSVKLTTTQGYFDGDTYSSSKEVNFYSDASTASGTETLTCTWNGAATDIVVDTTELEVQAGTNTIVATQSGLVASVAAIPSKTVNASTNTKIKLTDTTPSKKQVATFAESQETFTSGTLSNSKSYTVTGSYYYFIGNVTGTKLTIDSDMIRGLNTKKGFVSTIADAGTEVLSAVNVPANGNTTIIAVPTGYTIKQILALGKDAKSAWTNNGAAKTTVNVVLPNGSTHSYNVFYSENDGPADAEFSNLKLGK